jgi:hypothetical protein
MVMSSQAMVQLALKTLSCNQKDLALRLKVSTTQISKWKSGEYMSLEMKQRFGELIGIGGMDPTFVLKAGSLEGAERWEKLIAYLATYAHEEGDSVYNNKDALIDEQGLLGREIFRIFELMGVEIPKAFPADLLVKNGYLDADEETITSIHQHPLVEIILQIFSSFIHVNDFYKAYVFDLIFAEDIGLFESVGGEIDAHLMHLAASKIEVDSKLAPQFQKFKLKVSRDYEKWIEVMKEMVFESGKPLKAELMDLVYKTDIELANKAEQEAWGFAAHKRIHPDIYMNELLVGMRVIHQVLPRIMEKIGIDDFELDLSELRNQ